jgi:hypothetical protein
MSKRLYNLTFSKDEINDMAKYLTSGEMPAGMNSGRQRRFINRCKGFKVIQDQLVFVLPDKVLSVIPKEEVDAKLKEILQEPNVVGKGINQLNWWVKERYLGISRQNIIDALKKDSTWQLSFGRRKMASKSYLLSSPMQYWAMDLIDVNYYATHNNGYNYILTVIDLFSKFCWLRGLKHKTADETQKAFKDIVDSNQTPKKWLPRRWGVHPRLTTAWFLSSITIRGR